MQVTENVSGMIKAMNNRRVLKTFILIHLAVFAVTITMTMKASIVYLLQCPSNANGNAESEAPSQRHAQNTVQGIIKCHIPYVLIHKEVIAMPHTISNKCNDIRVPQTGCSSNHIHKLFFLSYGECYSFNVLDSQNLAQPRSNKSKKTL